MASGLPPPCAAAPPSTATPSPGTCGHRYWPGFYCVDKRGIVRHVRFGEGGYAESERWIRELLAE